MSFEKYSMSKPAENTDVVYDDLRSSVRVVTVDMAKQWLDQARPNRTISPRRVDTYAKSMKDDSWELNGAPIIFDEHGRLLDGRHRLTACVQSGTSFETLCVFGVKKESMGTIDIGLKRSPGDTLHILYGVVNANTIAAALKLLWLYNHSTLSAVSDKTAVPRTTLIEYYEKHQDISDSLPLARKAYRLLTPAASLFLTYVMGKKNQGLAERFFHTLGDGTNLRIGEGMYTLRKSLMLDWRTVKKTPEVYKMWMTVTIWNDWRKGKFDRRTLRYKFMYTEDGFVFPKIL